MLPVGMDKIGPVIAKLLLIKTLLFKVISLPDGVIVRSPLLDTEKSAKLAAEPLLSLYVKRRQSPDAELISTCLSAVDVLIPKLPDVLKLFTPDTLLLVSLNNKILLYDAESLNLNTLSVESYKTLPVRALSDVI